MTPQLYCICHFANKDKHITTSKSKNRRYPLYEDISCFMSYLLILYAYLVLCIYQHSTIFHNPVSHLHKIPYTRHLITFWCSFLHFTICFLYFNSTLCHAFCAHLSAASSQVRLLLTKGLQTRYKRV